MEPLPVIKATAGDIVLFRRPRSILGCLIRRFSTQPNDTTATLIEHVGGMINGMLISEAKSKIEMRSLFSYVFDGKTEILIARRKGLSDGQRQAIADYFREQTGRNYGHFKIVLHLGDYLISKIARRDVHLFRRLCKNNRYPICSWHVAFSYWKRVGLLFNAENPSYCQPDDIADDILINNYKAYDFIYCTPALWVDVVRQNENLLDMVPVRE